MTELERVQSEINALDAHRIELVTHRNTLIQQRAATGESHRSIARQLGISNVLVSDIVGHRMHSTVKWRKNA